MICLSVFGLPQDCLSPARSRKLLSRRLCPHRWGRVSPVLCTTSPESPAALRIRLASACGQYMSGMLRSTCVCMRPMKPQPITAMFNLFLSFSAGTGCICFPQSFSPGVILPAVYTDKRVLSDFTRWSFAKNLKPCESCNATGADHLGRTGTWDPIRRIPHVRSFSFGLS